MVERLDLKPWTRFGRLVLTWNFESRKWKIFDECRCDCGTVKFISRHHLRRWASNSCGCVRNKMSKERIIGQCTKHGLYWTQIYNKYRSLKSRCESKNNPSYANYGWRWIRCLWGTFEEFYKDMGESYKSHVQKYWESQTSIDRIDVNWNYCKENCRWATNIEQQNNRRNNVPLVYKWNKYKSLQEVCNKFWLKHYILRQRLKNWWSIDDVIEIPTLPRGKNRSFIY